MLKNYALLKRAGVLVRKVKCNFRTMGKKFGKLMKDVAARMATLTQEEIAELEKTERPYIALMVRMLRLTQPMWR